MINIAVFNIDRFAKRLTAVFLLFLIIFLLSYFTARLFFFLPGIYLLKGNNASLQISHMEGYICQAVPAAIRGNLNNVHIGFFNIDLNNPCTILSSQLALFQSRSLPLPDAEDAEKQGSEDHAAEDLAESNQPGEKLIEYEGIKIDNQAEVSIDIPALLAEPLTLDFSVGKRGVIIYHTHTSESYTPTAKNNYIPSDPFRTENPKYNVVRPADELVKELRKQKIPVFHDTTIHDYPTYTGCYRRSLNTITARMQRYPSYQLILDIHRDALGSYTQAFKPTASLEGTQAARIMFVVGTNGLGLEHPHWKENLKLALRLQQKANELYPDLCRPINLRKERFNQHVSPGVLIIEVGATGNTLEEALASMKYLAKVIYEVMNVKYLY